MGDLEERRTSGLPPKKSVRPGKAKTVQELDAETMSNPVQDSGTASIPASKVCTLPAPAASSLPAKPKKKAKGKTQKCKNESQAKGLTTDDESGLKATGSADVPQSPSQSSEGAAAQNRPSAFATPASSAQPKIVPGGKKKVAGKKASAKSKSQAAPSRSPSQVTVASSPKASVTCQLPTSPADNETLLTSVAVVALPPSAALLGRISDTTDAEDTDAMPPATDPTRGGDGQWQSSAPSRTIGFAANHETHEIHEVDASQQITKNMSSQSSTRSSPITREGSSSYLSERWTTTPTGSPVLAVKDGSWRGRLRDYIDRSPFIVIVVKPCADVFNNSAFCHKLRWFCIFVALFFPDLFVIWQVPNDWILDTLMCGVLMIFMLEFTLTTLTDASYIFSFFSLMDVVSSISVITDISFMLGLKASEPYSVNSTEDTGSSRNTIVRLTRMARLATRIARLTRTSKVLWMFLGEVEKRNQSQVLRVLTMQVRQQLTMRLSSIMFMVGIAVPCTMMFTYPMTDESLIVWPDLVNNDAFAFFNNTLNATRLSKKLVSFASFFHDNDYGPTNVCFRRNVGGTYGCDPSALGITWLPGKFSLPERGASQWIVSHDYFQATYDMSEPQKMEAWGNLLLVVTIIITLSGFAIDLNRHVTRLALNPLGRVLTVVQYHCCQIFEYAPDAIGQDDTKKEENYDMLHLANESALIETVVEKLIIIVERAVSKYEGHHVKVATTDEEKLVMCFQGVNTVVKGAAAKTVKTVTLLKSATSAFTDTIGMQASGPSAKNIVELSKGDGQGTTLTSAQAVVVKRPDTLVADRAARFGATIGPAAEFLGTPDFDALAVPKESVCIVAFAIMQSTQGADHFINRSVNQSQLSAFIEAVRDGYQGNPYHNFGHALDVMHTTSRHAALRQNFRFLSDDQLFVQLISAMSHNIGHPGLSNEHLRQRDDALALTYNDFAPLENMSLAKMFAIAAVEEQNIFAKVEAGSRRAMRKEIIEVVLCTDVGVHHSFLNQVALFYQLNSGELSLFESQLQLLDGHMLDVFTKEALMFQKLFVHLADNHMHSTKPWDLCFRLAQLSMDEYFAQGDLERAAGMPVQILHDSQKACSNYIQVGWITHFVLPMAEVVIHIFPPMFPLVEHVGVNFQKWMNLFQEASRPTQDEAWEQGERCNTVSRICEHLTTGAHVEENDWTMTASAMSSGFGSEKSPDSQFRVSALARSSARASAKLRQSKNWNLASSLQSLVKVKSPAPPGANGFYSSRLTVHNSRIGGGGGSKREYGDFSLAGTAPSGKQAKGTPARKPLARNVV